MQIGYARVSKYDDSQVLDSQIDALVHHGVLLENVYTDKISGKNDDRPGLINCLKALRSNVDDKLIVFKLDRLGRDLRHLLKIGEDLENRKIALVVLSGAGEMDTSTSAGRLMFQMFAAFAEFERELIRERTLAGLKAARARGRLGGRPRKVTKAILITAVAAMKQRETIVKDLCEQLGISKSSLYNHVGRNGDLTPKGKLVMDS